MTRRMLIDAAHAEETRVVVVDGSRIEELDFESATRKQLRGNIYLAKVTRVEPSLQAAFIEYGGNRHGFLAFNEIHPDYYQIPVADREALLREVEAEHDDEDEDEDERDEDDADDEAEEAFMRRQRRLMRRYKIQDVIRRRQIMLVQVVKEERGNKGAALTTYLSLAGRYGVLMPNTGRGGGISRKITSGADRKRLKSIVQGLDVPNGMGLIVRTAGAKRSGSEISRDYDYLLRLWENIRETTLKSTAPSLIYEEEDLVKRAIRDMFDKDIDSIQVEGEAGYREARRFMRMIMPGQSKKIAPYRERTPLFTAFKIEDQLAQLHQPTVPLRSGGYLVINQTEALVAIDVNSGRATRERNIEQTALKTNLEAAEEACRQLRLRDLAGLIVIDFIDMDESKNNRAVERVMKECLSEDRARVQMGKISPFGLMEISRQRRRTGVLEGATHVCEHCQGSGRVHNVESSALAALRAIEMEAARGGPGSITVRLQTVVALYILNEKRAYLSRLEQMHLLEVNIITAEHLGRDDVEIERTAAHDGDDEGAAARFAARRFAPPIEALAEEEEDDDVDFDELEEDEDEEPVLEEAGETEDAEDEDEAEAPAAEKEGRGRRGRRRRRGGRREVEIVETAPSDEEEVVETVGSASEDDEEDEDGEFRRGRRRRRGRRGGRRVREEGRPADPYAWVHAHGGRDRIHPSEDVYAWRDPHAADARPEERAYAREAERVIAEPHPAPTTAIAGPQVEAEQDPYVWTEGGEAGGEERDGRGRRRNRGGRGRGRDRDRRGRRGERGDEAGEVVSAEAQGDAEAVGAAEPAVASAEEAHAFDPSSRPERSAEPGPSSADASELLGPGSAPPSGMTEEDDEEAVTTTGVHSPVEDAEAAVPAPAPQTAVPPPAEPEAVAPTLAEPEPQPAEPAPAPPEPDPNEITGQAPAAPRRGWWRRKG